MKLLLISLNAKYIHTCLAIHSIKTYACAQLSGNVPEIQIETAEYTINQSLDDILRDILRKQPDLLACSCYIWNIEPVKKLAALFHMASPDVPIWLGGPEVTYDAKEVLMTHPFVSGILTGEGEKSFTELARAYAAVQRAGSITHKTSAPSAFAKVCGIVFQDNNGIIYENDPPSPLDLDTLVFPYPDLSAFEHRILYYESSRGCPFGCSYCLSSTTRSVRFKSVEKVFQELQRFLDQKIPLVKFVDRTFNCDHARTLAIWQYIKEHDNFVTRFHFEITADLLKEKELELLSSLRPGLVQLEIGVQSANPETLSAIHRYQDIAHLQQTVSRINAAGNVHQHLDLIAGLPYEDLDSFSHSFDTVYRMQPAQLQLGFLKLLKGSQMYQKKDSYGLQYRPWPPYEVVSTNWLSASDSLFLKAVESMVETYYNSNQFTLSLQYILHFFPRPWKFFSALAEWMEKKELLTLSHARITRYELLRRFAKNIPGVSSVALDAVLLFDLYLRENLKTRPAWAIQTPEEKERIGSFFAEEENRKQYLPDFASASVRQIRHETHLEIFPLDVLKTAETGTIVPEESMILFNYRKRNPLDESAEVICLF